MNATGVPEPIWDQTDDARYDEWSAEVAPSSEAAQALKIAMDTQEALEKHLKRYLAVCREVDELNEQVDALKKRVDLLADLEGDRIDKGVKPKPDYRAMHRRRHGR